MSIINQLTVKTLQPTIQEKQKRSEKLTTIREEIIEKYQSLKEELKLQIELKKEHDGITVTIGKESLENFY